jgi:hypothetical protein
MDPNYNVQKQLSKIDNQLSMIIAAINGNPFADGQPGIVKDIQEVKAGMKEFNNRLIPLEKFKDRMYWTWVLVLSGSGVVGSVCGLIAAYFKLKSN